jgi:hypothetical protein
MGKDYLLWYRPAGVNNDILGLGDKSTDMAAELLAGK